MSHNLAVCLASSIPSSASLSIPIEIYRLLFEIEYFQEIFLNYARISSRFLKLVCILLLHG
jgi:hypothetical protein